MSTVCRLCILPILPNRRLKSLFDNRGQLNEVYNIAVKYVDPKFVKPGNGHNSTVICIECWRQIMDFHQFYQSIINSQSTLENDNLIKDNVKLDKLVNEEHKCSYISSEIQLSALDEINLKDQISRGAYVNNSDDELVEINIIHIDEDNYMLVDNTGSIHANTDEDENIISEVYQCNLCEIYFENLNALEDHSFRMHNAEEYKQKNEDISAFNDFEIQMENEEPNRSSESSKQSELNAEVALENPLRKRKTKQNDVFIAECIGELECEICKQKFPNFTMLKQHYLIEHEDKEFHVICCEKRFKNKHKLVAHLHQFHNRADKNSTECKFCGATFSEYGNLRRHIRKKHPKETNGHKWLCRHCNEMFETRGSLEHHKAFKHPTGKVMEYINLKKDNRPVQRLYMKLNNCIESPQDQNLVRDNSQGVKSQPFSIDPPIENIHTPFIDIKNEDTIISDDEFDPYLQNRTDDNSSNCKFCGKRFLKHDSLRKHIRKQHPTECNLYKFLCKYCNEMFESRCSLEKHKSAKHVDIKKQNFNVQVPVDNFKSSHFIDQDKNFKNSQEAKNQALAIAAPIENINIPPIDIIDIKEEISDNSENEFEPKQTQFKEETYFCPDEMSINSNDEYNTKQTKYKEISFSSDELSLSSDDNSQSKYYDGKVIANALDSLKEKLLKDDNVEKAFKCDFCIKCFSNPRGLESHKRQVHIENRSLHHLHLCYCKRSRQSDSSNNQYDTTVCCQRKQKILEDDATIAKWKETLPCDICPSTFSYYSLLRVHYYYQHPGEQCLINCCNRKFYKLLDALEHIRLHLDPNAFKCVICDLKLGGKSRLVSHMRKQHDVTLNQKLSCDQCDKTFEYNFILTRHKNLHHIENGKN